MKKIIPSILLFLVSQPVFAGAWVQPEGKSLLITNLQWYESCDYWNNSAHLQTSPCYKQLQLNPYLEYGYTPDLTLGINPFIRQASQAQQNSGIHLDDVETFARYRLWHNDYSVFSTQISFNYSNYHPAFINSSSSTNNGQNWLGARLLYGTGGVFNKNTHSFWYANLEGGYQANLSGAADQIHIDPSIGWKNPTETWILELKSLNTLSLRTPSQFTANDYNLSTLALSVMNQLTPVVGLQAGVNQDIYGNNVGKGVAPFVALWWRN